jgi:hypothetical protein
VGPVRQREKGKRKREAGAWAAAGRSWWAAGPPGQKGGKGKFSFLFQTHFKTSFKLKFKSKFLLNLSQNFIIFLKVTQATKNHAKPNNDAQSLVVSILIKLSLIF